MVLRIQFNRIFFKKIKKYLHIRRFFYTKSLKYFKVLIFRLLCEFNLSVTIKTFQKTGIATYCYGLKSYCKR